MRYALSFKLNSSVAYPMLFYTWVRGVYPLYFYGFSLYEVVKYTVKYADTLGTEASSVILHNIESSSDVVKFAKLKQLQEVSTEVILSDGRMFSECKLTVTKLAEILTESYIDIKLVNSKQFTKEDMAEITYKVVSFIDAIYRKDVVGREFSQVELTTDECRIYSDRPAVNVSYSVVSLAGSYVTGGTTKDTSKYSVQDISHNVVVQGLLSKGVTLLNDESVGKRDRIGYEIGSDLDVTKTTQDRVEPNMLISGRELVNLTPVTSINLRDYKSITTPSSTISDYTCRVTDMIDVETLLLSASSLVESITKVEPSLLPRVILDDSIRTEITKALYSDGDIDAGVIDGIRNVILKSVDAETLESMYSEVKSVEHLSTTDAGLAVLKRIDGMILDVLVHSVTEASPNHTDTTPYTQVNSDKAYTDTFTNKYSVSDFVVSTFNNAKVEAEPFVEVKGEKVVSVSAVVDTNTNKYADVLYGRLWRCKTGGAFDNIWLNPQDTDLSRLASYREIEVGKFIAQVIDFVGKSDSYVGLRKKVRQLGQQDTKSDMVSETWLIVSEFLDVLDTYVREEDVEFYDLLVGNMSEIVQVFKDSYTSKYITPYTEVRELAVEGKISFKAMLDFILFIEQLIVSNRYFYSANRAIIAIDDIVKILDDWVTDGMVADEGTEQYEYLVRWFKWWASGERVKHLDDMELNGIVVLNKIKDYMVHYFESRWGKRIVEYGTDNMYIYSKDFSYIDRIRGKKHGKLGKLVDVNRMKEDYGVSESQLPMDVETETKGKRK